MIDVQPKVNISRDRTASDVIRYPFDVAACGGNADSDSSRSSTPCFFRIQPGDELHLVFEYQDICDKYPGLFGQHARTMVQFMWQADMHGVAKFVTDSLGVYSSTDPEGIQAPRAGRDVVGCLSLSPLDLLRDHYALCSKRAKATAIPVTEARSHN